MKWLNTLERKIGRFYIPRLMLVVVIGMAAVFFVDLAARGTGVSIIGLLTFNRSAIVNDLQLWRIITFIFIPPSDNPIWLLVGLYFYYMIGNNLESAWGSFRFNVYYFCGVLGAIAAGFLSGGNSNTYLNLSLFLAYAAIAPDTTFLMFFILPIKAKWLALGYAAFLALEVIFVFFGSVSSGFIALISLAFSLLNYFVFFGPSLYYMLKNQIRIWKNKRNWRRR